MANKSKAEACYTGQDYARSIKYAKQWLFAAKRVGNTHHERSALKIIGWSYYYLHNYEESIKYGEEVLRIAVEELDKDGELDAYELLARSYRTYEREPIRTGLEERTSDIEAAPQVLQIGSKGFPNSKSYEELTERGLHQRPADSEHRSKVDPTSGPLNGRSDFRGGAFEHKLPKNVLDEQSEPVKLKETDEEESATKGGLPNASSGIEPDPPGHIWHAAAISPQRKKKKNNNIYKCSRCPKFFMSSSRLKSHCEENHFDEDIKMKNGNTEDLHSAKLQHKLPEKVLDEYVPEPVKLKETDKEESAAKGGLPNAGSGNTAPRPDLKHLHSGKFQHKLPEKGLDEYMPEPVKLKETDKEESAAKGGLPNAGSGNTAPTPDLKLKLKETDEKESTAKGGLPNASSVPSEIKARGPRARLAYENALKNGKVKMYRGRIMLIGQDRAGKTSLKNSLLGLPFDPNEQSTDGIEVDPSKFEFDVEKVKNWQRVDEKPSLSQFAKDLVRMVAGELEEDETTMTLRVQNETNQVPIREENTTFTSSFLQTQKHPPDPHITSHSVNATTEPVIPELKIDPSSPSEEFTDLLVQHLKGLDLKNDATTIEHHLTLDLWDFAGQHLYYASYPVFLSPRAVYILVYNLKKKLLDKAQPSVRHGNIETPLKNPTSETNLDNLLSWLVTVSTMCSTHSNDDESKGKELLYLRPPVLIVGTHADEPLQDIKEIQEGVFGKDFEGHVMRPFFSVDNRNGDGIASLQKRIIEVLKQEPYMAEEVPLRWFNFEKVVKTLVARKTYYLKLEQLQNIARKVCFIEDENELGTMLDFYHDLGMIIRHRSTVVLRANWLIDVFRQLITIRPFNNMEPIHSKLWREMEITGVLRMELVDYVFSKFCQQGVIKEDILNMMEQFGLIAKFATSSTDVKYFVPAQLSSPPGRLCEKEPGPSDPCPLFLTFPAGFVPHGLFAQLVSRCIRWCSEIEFKMYPNLFDGASRFKLISKHFIYQLILICKKRFIKFVLLGKSADLEQKAPLAEIEEMASLVWRFLKETMNNLLCEFSYLTELKYEWCVACPDCPIEEDMYRLCLLNILEGGQLSDCPKSNDLKIPTVPGLKIWFPIKAVRPCDHPGTEAVYNMTARPRGITLIINNKLFNDHREQSTRHGSEEDVRQVEALFDALGFDVRIRENLTRLQLLNELDSVSCQDHSHYDCFVLWLMSHGKSGEVYCTDGVTLLIQTARDLLCNANCVTLRGKPKLLFVQACRGKREDEGVAVMTNICSLPHAQQSSHVDSPTDPREIPALKVPEQADFLTAYSTVDEYVSYRLPDLGSTYVRALVKVFQERVAHDHLLEILTKVNQRVSEMENVEPKLQNGEHAIKIFKQVSQIESTLTKCLWF